MRNTRTVFLGLLVCMVLMAAAPAAGQGVTEKIIALIQGGKCADAKAILDQELKLAPEWGYGHFLYGICLQSEGRQDEAVSRYMVARQKDPDLFAAYHNEAGILYAQKKYAQTIAILDKGLAKASPDEKTQGLRLKGKACALVKDYGAAVEALKPSAGGDCEANYFLGHAHYGLGEWKEASGALGKAVGTCSGEMRAKSQDLRAKADLNRAHGNKKLYEQAMKGAKKALDAGQGSWKTYAEAALGAQEYAEAEKAFRKVLASKAGDCNATMNLGQALLGAKKYAAAEKELAKAVQCLEGDARRNALIQQGYARMGDARPKAAKYAERSNPCDVDISGRENVIKVLETAMQPFETAKSQAKVDEVNNTIASLREQIQTIRDNVLAREENEKQRLENLRVWKIEIELDKAKDKDRDGVPDPEDKCDGTPAPGDPVGLDGCPYKAPCT